MTRRSHKIYTALVLLFLYIPIFILIFYSFNDGKTTVFKGFTLKWYSELFKDTVIMESLLNSFIVATVSSISATVLGTMAALGIFSMKKKTGDMVLQVSNLPIINPEIVTGVSLMLMFVFFSGLLGFELGMGSVILAHISFSVPYVVLNVLPKLRQMNKNIYEAALDLGCSPASAFRKVVIPEIMPGVVSGFLMAFTFSLDDFIITYFTRGSKFQTLPIEIYTMLRRRLSPKINALSTLMFLIVLVALILINIKDYKQVKRGAK
jgi:spermidine/putrescine transport system permease protein